MMRLILFLLLAAAIIAVIINEIKKIPIEYFFLHTDLKEDTEALKDFEDMKEEFFKRAQPYPLDKKNCLLFRFSSFVKRLSGIAGETGADGDGGEVLKPDNSKACLSSFLRPIKFLRLSFYSDIIFVESAFQCARIPYYVEFPNLTNVYAGFGAFGFNASNVYILEKDYEEALILIEEYIASKKNCKPFSNPLKYIGGIITERYIPDRHDTLGIVVYKRAGQPAVLPQSSGVCCSQKESQPD